MFCLVEIPVRFERKSENTGLNKQVAFLKVDAIADFTVHRILKYETVLNCQFFSILFLSF